MLRSSDPEAVQYLARKTLNHPLPELAQSIPSNGESSTSRPVSAPSQDLPPTESSAPPSRAGPIRKKPRKSLEAMAAELNGKKMTTLEKVQLFPRMQLWHQLTCGLLWIGKSTWHRTILCEMS